MIDRLAISGTEFPHRPLHELLDVAERLEVKNLELWIPHNFSLEDLPSVEKEMTRRDLKAAVISTWTQLNLAGDVAPRQQLIQQSIQAAKALGAPSVNTYFGQHASRSPEEAVQVYRENILPCLEVAAKNDIYITLENEFEVTGNDITRRAEWVRRLIEVVDSPHLRVNFDPCNFYFAGEEPYPGAYFELKDHIGYIHLKDGMKYNSRFHQDPGEGFLWKDLSGDYVCCDLGKGAINYVALLRQLRDNHYDGFIGLEPHVHPTRLLKTFERSIKFIETQFQLTEGGETQ